MDSSEHKSKKRREAEKKTKPNESSFVPRKVHFEHLERSDLSEEHNPPAFVPNHYSSMPSIPKSSLKNAVQAADPNGKRPSMIFRIKVPLKKHNDPQPASICNVPHSSLPPVPPSTSSKTQATVTESTPQPKPQSRLSEEPCFSGRPAEAAPACIIEAEPSKPRHRSSHGHRIRKSERRFRELILNWKPPPLQLNMEEEDLDWLFSSRRQPKDVVESGARISEGPIPKPSTCLPPTDSLQPRACYLPEFDMYALPYVIPF